jgi:hypothetical protein
MHGAKVKIVLISGANVFFFGVKKTGDAPSRLCLKNGAIFIV